jgi:hypothetical protein
MQEHVIDKSTDVAGLARRPRVSVLGVDFVHVQLPDGDDLYLTEHGVPFARQLLPENYWTDHA